MKAAWIRLCGDVHICTKSDNSSLKSTSPSLQDDGETGSQSKDTVGRPHPMDEEAVDVCTASQDLTVFSGLQWHISGGCCSLLCNPRVVGV
ncbi:hypothetical protein EYF80_035979 [Liparis tanakae]|uniref:Uncharacterized protein n=1 Tax=Liparis tanakae TaxID=230148 RepID=A0A4Z2GM05_9TELE|nr:hypothetical protein EYF80_035979 [Liparis tanakae]